jgi:hypothetical protein
LEAQGHHVICARDAIVSGSPDLLVWAAAFANEAILVSFDGDMRSIARHYGVGVNRYRRLSMIKISCRESRAVERLRAAMSLIAHEWHNNAGTVGRRLHIEIGTTMIKTNR